MRWGLDAHAGFHVYPQRNVVVHRPPVATSRDAILIYSAKQLQNH